MNKSDEVYWFYAVPSSLSFSFSYIGNLPEV